MSIGEEDFSDFLHKLLASLIDSIPNAQTGTIMVREGNRLLYKAAIGYELKKLQLTSFKVGKEHLVSTDHNLNLVTYLKDWNKKHLSEDQFQILERYGKLDTIKVLITFPLIIDDEIWGSFNIENHDRKDALTQKDVKLAKRFKIIAEKLIRAKLHYETLNKRYKELLDRIKTNEELYDKFGHDISNHFQLLLLIISQTELKSNINVKEIKQKIFIINEIAKSIKQTFFSFNFDENIQGKIERLAEQLNDTLTSLFKQLLGLKLTIQHNNTIIMIKDLLDRSKGNNFEKNVIADSTRFPLLGNYNIEISLYITDSKSKYKQEQSEAHIFSKQIQLLILTETQNILLQDMNFWLEKSEENYKQLLSFYIEEIDPFLPLLSKYIPKDQKLAEYWMKSLSIIEELVSNIVKQTTDLD